MLLLLSLCVGALLLNLLIQLGAIAAGIKVITRWPHGEGAPLFQEIRVLGILVTVLFFGHLLQIAVWALIYQVFGQFDDFGAAFYHSTVNYTTLGYGDMVMDHPWRLAGALEASVGVMMFGVSTATLFATISHLSRGRFGRNDDRTTPS